MRFIQNNNNQNQFSGFINLIKPPAMTSAQAVGILKKLLGFKKIGHSGTLDPLAAGVLPVMLGRTTKLFNYVQEHFKEYIVELKFGLSSDTMDLDYHQIEKTDFIPKFDDIMKILPNFIGNIEQIPPKYSALKINGARMYDLARKGIDFDVKKRNVEVYDIRLLQDELYNNSLRLYIKCASGFYVRSFCTELAESLGSKAIMTSLIRVSVCNFNIQNAFSFEQIQECINNNDYSFILSPDYPLVDIDKLDINDLETKKIKNGQTIKSDNFYKQKYLRLYNDNNLIAIAIQKGNLIKSDCLLQL